MMERTNWRLPTFLPPGSVEMPGKSLLSAAKKKLLDINCPQVLQGFVLPDRAENPQDDPDGLFNELLL